MKDQNICHKKKEISSPNRAAGHKNSEAVTKAAAAAEANPPDAPENVALVIEMKGIEVPALLTAMPAPLAGTEKKAPATPIRNVNPGMAKAVRTLVTSPAGILVIVIPAHPAAGTPAVKAVRLLATSPTKSVNSAAAKAVRTSVINPAGILAAKAAGILVTNPAGIPVTVIPVRPAAGTSGVKAARTIMINPAGISNPRAARILAIKSLITRKSAMTVRRKASSVMMNSPLKEISGRS